jgi:hypothetical protein
MTGTVEALGMDEALGTDVALGIGDVLVRFATVSSTTVRRAANHGLVITLITALSVVSGATQLCPATLNCLWRNSKENRVDKANLEIPNKPQKSRNTKRGRGNCVLVAPNMSHC